MEGTCVTRDILEVLGAEGGDAPAAIVGNTVNSIPYKCDSIDSHDWFDAIAFVPEEDYAIASIPGQIDAIDSIPGKIVTID